MRDENILYNLSGLAFSPCIFLFLMSCTLLPKSNNSLTIVVDSVFINQYEEGESFGPLYIYYHLSIMNKGIDTLNINLPMSSFEEKPQGHNFFYGIYRNDTIPFYSGANTLVIPGEKASYTVRYGCGIKIRDLYENGYNQEFNNIQGFMYDLVINSKLYFQIMSLNYALLPLKTKITYRDPDDKDEHTWPL